MKIYVGNLSYQTTEDNLRDFFADCGEVADVKIIIDRETRRSKGFGFVTFETQEGADKALALSEPTLDGRNLRIDKAQEGKKSGGGSNGGRGGWR